MFHSDQLNSTGVSNKSSDLQSSNTEFVDEHDNAAGLQPSVSENEVHRQLQSYNDFVNLDDLYIDVVSPPFQSCDDEIRRILDIGSKDSSRDKNVFPLASFEMLRKHQSERLRLGDETSSLGSMMSTERIIELAAEHFISKELSLFSHPYPSSILGQDSRGFQLIQNLLYSAEKIGEKKYERSRKFLEECDRMSSCTGSPIERLVLYFTEALYEKIDRETGLITPRGLGKKIPDHLETMKSTNTYIIALQQKYPLTQIAKLVGIEALVDHVVEARKVHVIDIHIMSGVQCTILMQNLVARPGRLIQHLKITAVGIKSKTTMEETGRRLMAFAESLNLKFSFHIVMVDDMLDLNTNLFEIDPNEVVCIYAAYGLKNMIGRPDRLEHLMNVAKSLRPRVMIVTEMETNCNSPYFLPRFVEALFFYGAFFDSVAECMKNDEEHRKEAEETCFGSAIRNVVATEGDERKVRYVSINVWRAFLSRFGLVETDLSTSCLYQANLMRDSFPFGKSCTLGMNGECVTIGWNGTPLITVSAWKF